MKPTAEIAAELAEPTADAVVEARDWLAALTDAQRALLNKAEWQLHSVIGPAPLSGRASDAERAMRKAEQRGLALHAEFYGDGGWRHEGSCGVVEYVKWAKLELAIRTREVLTDEQQAARSAEHEEWVYRLLARRELAREARLRQPSKNGARGRLARVKGNLKKCSASRDKWAAILARLDAMPEDSHGYRNDLMEARGRLADALAAVERNEAEMAELRLAITNEAVA